MSKLIDVDEAIVNFGFEWDDIPPTREEFVRFLKKQPTVNAVPVVKCRECKHRGTDDCIFHIKGEPADEELLLKLDNDFCSYGERKEGADNEP